MPIPVIPVVFEPPLNSSSTCTQHPERRALRAIHFTAFLHKHQSSGHVIHLCEECLKELCVKGADELATYYRLGGK